MIAAAAAGVNGAAPALAVAFAAMITRLTIDGMRSVHCTRAVFTALTAVEGISAADVRLGAATIEHDGRATPDALRAAVATAGYEVTSVVEERRRLL
jgi:copper chaperone CopZ